MFRWYLGKCILNDDYGTLLMIRSTLNNIVCSSSKRLQKTSDCKKKGGALLAVPLPPVLPP